MTKVVEYIFWEVKCEKMEEKYLFYYDEANHNRKLTTETLINDNFDNFFCGVIIGLKENNLNQFENTYLQFENKWKTILTISKENELKSSVITAKKYKNGLSSLNKNDLLLLSDLFKLVKSNNLTLYCSFMNKIEFLVDQLLIKSNIKYYPNYDSICYSITKSLCVYHPKNVLSSIQNQNENFLNEFKEFLIKRIDLNHRTNGESETSTFLILINILKSVNTNLKIDWNYRSSFLGFTSFLREIKLTNYKLFLDKEGTNNTYKGAKKENIQNLCEMDSKDSCGIRCADMIVGFISRMLNALEHALMYKEDEIGVDSRLLDDKWFDIDEEKFKLYKLIYSVLIEQKNAWFKFFTTRYADGVICLVTLLNFFNSYNDFDGYKNGSIEDKKLKYNTMLYYEINGYFKRFEGSYSIDPIEDTSKEFYYNQKGAKCYFDFKKHAFLKLPQLNQKIEYFVLSVGFFGKMEQACITISEEGKPVCYLLPNSMLEWTTKMVASAQYGVNYFPCFIILENINEKILVHIERAD